MNRRVDLERWLPWLLGLLAILIWIGPLQWLAGATSQISDIPTYEGAYQHMAEIGRAHV